MPGWECAIGGCSATFERVDGLLTHQVESHERTECAVCGAIVPDGFFAIEHVFDEHSRAQFVRAYDADANAVRERESVKRDVEDAVDTDVIRARLADDSSDDAETTENTMLADGGR